MSERGLPVPDRPAVPPAFWALVAVLVWVRGALANAPDVGELAAAAGAVLVTAALVSCALRRRLPEAAALVLVLAAAVAAASLSAGLELARQQAVATALSHGSVLDWKLAVESDMTEGAHGWRGRARATRGDGLAGMVWLVSDEPVARGDTLTCVGRFSPNGEGEWGRSSRMQGLAGTVRVVRVQSREGALGLEGCLLAARAHVLASFGAGGSDERALLAGSVCGSSAALAARGLSGLFSKAGVSHLTAVSGGHLVLVAGVMGALLGRTRLRPASRAVALAALTGVFVGFCGTPVSAVRSWAMSVAAAASGLVGRRSHPLSAVSVVALAMALLEPGVTGQLGYLLSVLCVCGICLFGRYARWVCATLAPRLGLLWRLPPRVRAVVGAVLAPASEAVSLTLVSLWVSAPLTCAAFGQLSLVAPLANAVLAPVFPLVLGLGLLAAALSWAPLLQAPVLAVADLAARVFLGVLRAVASLPFASVAVEVDERAALALMAALSLALWLWWPHPSRRALLAVASAAACLALAWILRWRLFAPACLRVLDVGQGDAILVTDGAASLLVDTGPGDPIVAALARAHVFHLDAVVFTHLHEDHVGGLDDLLSTVDVGEVLVAEGVDAGAAAEGLPVREVGLGTSIGVGGFELDVVAPAGAVDGADNEDSLVMALTYEAPGASEPQLTALLTGDAEAPEVTEAVARAGISDIDVLKVGHHGSAAAVDEALAERLSPVVSIASAGEGNPYGHPTPECVSVLEAAGSQFLCTMDAGDVCVWPYRDSCRVTWDGARDGSR